MKIRVMVVVLGLALSFAATSHAQRILDADETTDILKTLTSRNRTTWIAAGVIEGTHEAYKAPTTTDAETIESKIQQEIKDFEANPDEILRSERLQEQYLEAIPFNVRYRLANESTTISHEVVKYDGQRFSWQIDIDSRSDSIAPTWDLADNEMADSFDLSWNERRTFAWDGSNFTIYSASGQYATIDADNQFPHTVNGPLTAGFVNWGRGTLTYSELSDADTSAVELERDGMTQIQLVVKREDGTSDEFFLIPEMDYAVGECTLTRADNMVTNVYCDSYEKVADGWVPGSVLVETRDAFSQRLLQSDRWDIKAIQTDAPKSDAFRIDFYENTAVQYFSSLGNRPSQYYYSGIANIDTMLAEHLTYSAQEGLKKQNCATASLKYAAARLGVSIPNDRLQALVNAQGQTSLKELGQCIADLGLQCRTLKTDLSAVKDLHNCQILLAQGDKGHLVAIDRVDSDQAWVVDLTNNNFYYRQDISSLGRESTIMLVSDSPIVARVPNAADAPLNTEVGALPMSCTEVLQWLTFIECQLPGCPGYFYVYFDRLGCEPSESGTCENQYLAQYARSQCYLPLGGSTCQVTGDWVYQPMLACE